MGNNSYMSLGPPVCFLSTHVDHSAVVAISSLLIHKGTLMTLGSHSFFKISYAFIGFLFVFICFHRFMKGFLAFYKVIADYIRFCICLSIISILKF